MYINETRRLTRLTIRCFNGYLLTLTIQRIPSISMELVAIASSMEENSSFYHLPGMTEILLQSIEYYNRVGYVPPWVGYYASKNGAYVGCGGFKGKPVNGSVEISYGTFENLWNRGIGTEICKALVQLSLNTNPAIKITARTIEDNNASGRVLQKNGFRLIGTVIDPDDGEVFEWEYDQNLASLR